MNPIKVMKYNPVSDTMISGDTKGIIEYWSATTLQFPEDEYVLVSLLIKNAFIIPFRYCCLFSINWSV